MSFINSICYMIKPLISYFFSTILVFLCFTTVLHSQEVWEKLPNQPSFSLLGATYFTAGPDGTLWILGDASGNWISTDKGNTYSTINTNPWMAGLVGEPRSTAFTSGGRIYVGTSQDGVQYSDDQGNSWTKMAGPGNGIKAMTISASGDVLAGIGGGVYVYAGVDSQFNHIWNRILQSPSVHELLTLPSGAILAATDGGIYHSTDNGVNWTHVYTCAQQPAVYAFTRTSSGTIIGATIQSCSTFIPIYGGLLSGIIRSEDDGLTWSNSDNGVTTPFGACLYPMFDAVSLPGDFILVSRDLLNYGVIFSADNGNNWQDHHSGIQSNARAQFFALTPDNELFLYAKGFNASQHGIYKYTDVPSSVENLEHVEGFKLFNAYPNPFNPSTTIKYQLSEAGLITVKIYNSLGEEVTNLVNEFKEAGSHSVQFNAGNLSSGVYFYRIAIHSDQLNASGYSTVRKMILTK